MTVIRITMNKMKSLFASAITLAVPSLIWAVPADPRPRVITNPDGSKVEVRMHGDEHFHFMTDLDCTTIMQRNADGFLVNATRYGSPLAFNRENVELLRAEKEAQYSASTRAAAPEIQRMATLDSNGRTNYPTIGNDIRSLVVLVEFQDVQFTVPNPREYYTRQLNESGFSEYGACGSALDYYRDASHGLYTPQFDVYGPVRINYNTTHFADDNNKTKNMNTLIREAITTLCDSGELDLSNYDYDNDGTLDTVFIYYAGYGSADSNTMTIWPHQSSYYGSTLRFNGVKVGPYACANELDGYNPQTHKYPYTDGSEPWVGGVGTFIHEYGHVLGLPDMYDVNYSGGVVTPGQWDVMDQGSYNFNGTCPPLFSAYEQWVCRWLDYVDAEDDVHYDLNALGNTDNPSAVRIPILMGISGSTYASEYFVIESRDNSKWDSCFPNSGLMVWRINYKKSLWTGNSVNSVNGSNVEIVYANGDNDPLYDDGVIYPGGDNELIPANTYSRWKSPFITGISYNAAEKFASFDYNVITEAPSIFTVLSDQPYADTGTAKNFTLEWQPVDEADSYLLTIRRVSTEKPLGVYEDFNVGLKTSYKAVSVPISYWNNEIEAYIRVVKDGMKSSMTSNIVRFVPKDLPKGKPDEGAVDAIDTDDVNISGGVGCVIAPEGAVVYNLSGQQLRNENLAPGIYLVSFAGRTAKVLVR